MFEASSNERRVVIVDDSRTIQAMLDNAFSRRADFRVVGFADDAQSAADMIRRLMPDVATIDLCMPYLDGAALLAMISDLESVCKVMISDRAVSNLILTSKLLEAGASACIGKSDLARDPASFFKKINRAADTICKKGKHPLSTTQHALLLSNIADHNDWFARTTRFPIPADEADRLDIIGRKNLSNPIKERHFDLITKHVAKVTAFPSCLLTVIDRDTQWIKSAYGLEAESTPRHQAFCNYTISQAGTFVVANAAADYRFSSNPLVTGAPNIRTYAGHPVVTDDGVSIATLCIIDSRIRKVSKDVIDQLAGMAGILSELMEQRPMIAA